MNSNGNSKTEMAHAPFSASSPNWIYYDDNKLIASYKSMQDKIMGTILHEYAAQAIRLGRKQDGCDTVSMYINDAIGFRMTPEKRLFYSNNFFGTADAICFRKNKLRIHDLKTGRIPAHMEQLRVYASYFCLSNDVDPKDIEIELRIYQNNDIIVDEPTIEHIMPIIDRIVTGDKLIESIKHGEDYYQWMTNYI